MWQRGRREQRGQRRQRGKEEVFFRSWDYRLGEWWAIARYTKKLINKAAGII
jgi:hypothetical protein